MKTFIRYFLLLNVSFIIGICVIDLSVSTTAAGEPLMQPTGSPVASPLVSLEHLPPPPSDGPNAPLTYANVYYETARWGELSEDAPDWVRDATHAAPEIQADTQPLVSKLAGVSDTLQALIIEECSSVVLKTATGVFAICRFGPGDNADKSGLVYFDLHTGEKHVTQPRTLPPPRTVLVNHEIDTVFFDWPPDSTSFHHNRKSTIAAYDITSGEVRWQDELETIARQRIEAQILGDSLLVPHYNQLRKYDLNKEFPLAQPTWQAILLDYTMQDWRKVGDTLYVATQLGYLYAIDWETGFVYWVQDLSTTLDPALVNLHILEVDAEEMTVVGYAKESAYLRIFAQLKQHEDNTTVVPPPLPTPTRMLMPTPVQTPVAFHIPKTSPIRSLLDLSGLQPIPAPTLVPSVSWRDQIGEEAVKVDLDNDGVDEWLVLVARLADLNDGWIKEKSSPSVTTLYTLLNEFNVGVWDYLLFEQQEEGEYLPVAFLSHEDLGTTAGMNYQPRIVAIEDINQDGNLEIIFHSVGSGATTYFYRLSIWQWNGTKLQDLLAERFQISYTNIAFVDLNNDGVPEIQVRGGTSGNAGTGFERPKEFIYAWQGGQYHLISRTPVVVTSAERPFPLFDIIDAQRTAQSGDFEHALQLANRTVLNPVHGNEGIGYLSTETELKRLASYAALQAMYIHALRGEVDTMRAYLYEIETKQRDPDNLYVDAARFFLQTYEATSDPTLSCRLLRYHLALMGDFSEPLEWSTRTAERLVTDNICSEEWGIGGEPVESQFFPTPIPTPTPTPTPTPLPPSVDLSRFAEFELPTAMPAPTLLPSFDFRDKIGATHVSADIDNDGIQEQLITVQRLLEHNGAWESVSETLRHEPRSMWANVFGLLPPSSYLIFEQQTNGSWVPAGFIPQMSLLNSQLSLISLPTIIGVEDINGDGQKEVLIFSAGHSGTGTSFGYLTFWQWNGTIAKNLMHSNWRGGIESTGASFHFIDLDEDQKQEISVIGGVSGYPGLDEHRAWQDVYAWSAELGEYQLVSETPTNNSYLLFTVVDAQSAIHRGDWTQALVLVKRALFSSRTVWSNGQSLSAEEIFRLKSYAIILGMYVHARQNRIGAVDAYYHFLKTCCDQPNEPHIQAASLFWKAYRASGDAEAACTILAGYFRQLDLFADVMDVFRHTEKPDPLDICYRTVN